ncbi:hypothetical protein QQP08_001528 [Theobroma cacao]|nr:hypothetical protein QQP08_001528 [Theobroma cacao]
MDEPGLPGSPEAQTFSHNRALQQRLRVDFHRYPGWQEARKWDVHHCARDAKIHECDLRLARAIHG